MRVLQLITQTRGGPVDHAAEVAVELARRGHDSHLAGPPGVHLDAAATAGVTTHLVNIRGVGDLTGLHSLAHLAARMRPDVLHLQDRRAGLFGRTVATGRRLGSVYTLHGVPDQLAGLVPGNLDLAPPRRGDRLRYLHLERLLAQAPRSAVVTPCEALAAYARDQIGVRRARVHVVPNGIGRAWLETAPASMTAEAGDPTALRVTWLGLMQPVKRVPDLVAASSRVPGLRLVLVGDGPERNRITTAIAQASAPGRVELAGFRDDPTPYLAGADVLALPSAAEAAPMALLQAMACGIPVVATRVGGVPEMVRDGVDGLLVAPGDVAALARALAELAGDPVRRRAMGAAARARVVERFGIERTVTSLLDVYEEVAA